MPVANNRLEREMDMVGEVFDLIEGSFGFLESELGLRLERALRRRRPAYLTRIELVYANRTTGVVVEWEPRDLYVFVMLCRLVGGQYRRNIRNIGPDTELNCFELNDLVQVREPSDVIRGPGWGLDWPSPPGGLKGIIAGQARNLRRYSRPIIDGDFSVFPELDRIVKARAKDADIREMGDERASEIWGDLG
jgi:hypothetical protein